MYSAVYKCVCKQYGDRLYQDLINHVRTKMAEWSRNLTQVSYMYRARIETGKLKRVDSVLGCLLFLSDIKT